MQTNVTDVSGNCSEQPSLVKKIIEVIKNDIVDTLQVVRETEKKSKL
jgi:hypothetical protein